MARPGRAGIILMAGLAAGCGDDGTGPEDGDVEFPSLDAAIVAEFCIRGTATPTVSRTEVLADTDCPTVFPVGFGPDRFYETWRVRVASSRSVTFEMSSVFDSFLDVFLIADPTAPVLDFDNLVDFDDDGGNGDDARLTVDLESGTEYWVMVSGFEPIDLGAYTLEIRTD